MNAEELKQVLVRRLREQGSDPVLNSEKTVTQLCGKLQDWDPSDRAVYRAMRAEGLSIAEAGNALRIAAALRSASNTDLLRRLEPEEGSSKPRKRNRSQTSEDKKRKKPKI